MESSFEGLNFEILHESFESDANFSCNTPVIVDCDVEEAGYRELINSLQEDANFCNDVHREGEETALIGNLHAKREAIQQGRHDLLQLLLQRDDTIEDDMVVTACDRKDRGSIRILLDFGWQINKPVYNAASLLCTAVSDVELMHWLIAAGAEINARNELDESVLSIAVARGSLDVVHLLIAHGADIRHGDVLHCAAQRQNQSEGAELVHQLAAKGAEVNGYRYNNSVALKLRGMSTLPTPLHVACHENNLPVAKALLKHGADPYRKLLRAGKLVEPPPLTEQ